MRRLHPIVSTLALLAATACGDVGASRGAGAAGLATQFDSTADTIVARVAGAVPLSAQRKLVEELRIAPGVEDTSLFTEVFEFDVDRAGRFWVFDRPSNRIFLFGADGKLIRKVGRQGAGPGEFNGDGGMVTLADTGLAIWDPRNARVSFFTAAGDFRTSWSTPAGFFTSNGLLADRSGALYLRRPVTPPREGEILGRMGLVRLKAGGAFGDSLAPPDISVPREVYIAVHVEGKSNRSRSSTSSGFAPNYFWAWHPEGWFVAAHGGKFDVILARTGAKPVVLRRESPPVRVSEDERGEEEARILWQMRQTDAGWTWAGPPIPQTKAPLQELFVARDGRIWARVAVPSERIPESEIEPPRDPKNAPPVSHFRSPAAYEVFAPDGRFLGRVAFPARTTLMEGDGVWVWAVSRDESDLPGVVRYRIEPALR